jgi:hypothetical protein
MKSYLQILKEKSAAADVSLKKAFIHSGVRDSTYYRAIHGNNLRHETANRVEQSIEKLHSLQERDKRS